MVTYITFMAMAMLLWHCGPIKQYSSKKSKYIPGTDQEYLDLHAAVFHENDSVSNVYVDINNNNLLYKRNDNGETYSAEVKVSFSLSLAEDGKKTCDTGSFYMFDPENTEPVPLKSLGYQFTVRAKFGHNYFLKLETIDLNRKTLNTMQVKVNKADRLNGQNFLIQNAGVPVCQPYFLKSQLLKIKPNRPHINTLKVYCYLSDTKAARNP